MSKLWTDAHLRAAFKKYNRLYFGNSLEVLRLQFRKIPGLGHTYRIRKHQRRSAEDAFGISISPSQRTSRRLWAITLLHEMVHVEQKCRYSCAGPKFNARMLELAKAGAFNRLW